MWVFWAFTMGFWVWQFDCMGDGLKGGCCCCCCCWDGRRGVPFTFTFIVLFYLEFSGGFRLYANKTCTSLLDLVCCPVASCNLDFGSNTMTGQKTPAGIDLRCSSTYMCM
jgi:hypothetical protein